MLRVQITKQSDGGGVLRCVRADGSVTWQKQGGRNAAFFALHDLTHFAVESVLGIKSGFFGLIAEGWNIDDTTGKGSRGPLPDEAGQVEFIVGALDGERASGALLTAEDLNDHAAIHASSASKTAPRALTDAELQKIRASRSELFRQWSALAPGSTLELQFA